MEENHPKCEPNIVFVGGGVVLSGNVSTPPRRWSESIQTLLRRVETSNDWSQWWSLAEAPTCELFYWIGGPKTKVSVRQYKTVVRAEIDRSVDFDGQDPGSEAALADVQSLVDRLRDRFELPPSPALEPKSGATRQVRPRS